jgi:hypothetical protein
MLKSLSIRFGEILPHKTELDRIRIDLESILDALVFLGTNLPRPLESLSLTRLPPLPLEQYNDPAFLALRANLSLFEVHIGSVEAWTSPDTPLPEGVLTSCQPFYYDTLPGRLLTPPSAATGLENLEALALCFSDDVGVFPLTYPFSKLHFPRLRALRLQHVQFSVARDAENFILQHAETLLELHLLHAQIAISMSAEESTDALNDPKFNFRPEVQRRFWSEIYEKLNKKLQRLVFLDVDDAWWIIPERYVAYNSELKEIIQIMAAGRDDDTYQLEIFRNTVRDRADKLATEYEREYFPSSSKPLPILMKNHLASFPIRDREEFVCDCR